MAQMLYYVDGRSRITPAEAAGWGLGYAFPDGHMVCSEFSAAGPGGTQGCVVGRAGERLGYYPDRQTWLKMPALKGADKGPAFYVGCWNDGRPTPAELQVEEPLRGTPVRLGDGNHWTIPVARCWNDRGEQAGWYNALPGKLTLDANGEWAAGGVEAKHAHLWELGTRWWESMMGREPDKEGSVRFDFAGAHDAALSVLASNYRLSRPEVVLLGLFDDQLETASAVLNALVDWSTFVAWAKKNLIERATVGSPSPAGEPAAIPPTAPPSPTSGRSTRSRRK